MTGTGECEGAAALYLDLLKKCLTRYGFEERLQEVAPPKGTLRWRAFRAVQALLATRGFLLAMPAPPVDLAARAVGRDVPAAAETMIGLRRLDNLHECIADVLRRGVPGDLIETGVWRGGATIFMRAALAAYGDADRFVWAADFFAGLPKPDAARYPADAGDRLWTYPQLAVSLAEVQANFARYGLLDDRVRFLVGWFKDTLPSAPIARLAVARLDGDLYESTMDALRALYPKLSVGGYLIVDDYNMLAGCQAAVDEYRAEHGIAEAIQPIDHEGVFWRRER